MKAIILSLTSLSIGFVPTTPAFAAGSTAAVGVIEGQNVHDHGWHVHYRHHHGGHHVAGPFQSRHGAEHYADHLRHQGYHVERIAHN